MNSMDSWFRQIKTCVSKPYTVGALYYLLCHWIHIITQWETQNFIDSEVKMMIRLSYTCRVYCNLTIPTPLKKSYNHLEGHMQTEEFYILLFLECWIKPFSDVVFNHRPKSL